MDPKVFIAFRFHGNFYHSYRGDTPDELGFGKDIRIIRQIIQVLDGYNARGIPVRGTWDFENYFSLEKIMPAHCPDLIQALQRRSAEAGDEIEYMSYNNGWINAHTAAEFEADMQRARTNPQGSGLQDLFGQAVYPMVRPQEMMFTPIHLKLYRAVGIEAISLYYSSLPFNGFSNFVPRLGLKERYNPLTLTYPGIDETLTLLPCYNVGDLADHLTLRRWVKAIRRQQLAMSDPCDLLLLIDHDADDSFWVGFAAPAWVKQHLSTVQGLPGLLNDLQGLDYVAFTTPGQYLRSHPPVGMISFGQDTADGSFDGLASWAEKWSNHQLATGLERARILELQARRLASHDPAKAESIRALLEDSFDARLKLLSTTHFGMAAPVMNLTREGKARDLVTQAVDTAASALKQVAPPCEKGWLCLADYVRGVSTSQIQYQAHPSKALVRLALKENTPGQLRLHDEAGHAIPSAVLPSLSGHDLAFVTTLDAGRARRYSIETDGEEEQRQTRVRVTHNRMENEMLWVLFDEHHQLVSLQQKDRVTSEAPLLTSAVTYGGKLYRVEEWQEEASESLGSLGFKRLRGSLVLKGGYEVVFEREIVLASGLPYLYVTTRVTYPRTPDQAYSQGNALRLQQAWDGNWQEVLPCEIRPGLIGSRAHPLRVWKHNYCDALSSYSLDYGAFSANRQLDSANNQITHAWVAVSNGMQGFLLAQTADVSSSFAFCPLRTRCKGNITTLRMAPFGSYWGKQYAYATASTGLGKLLVTRFSAADHIKPYAPSYNGRTQTFRLLLAPYGGDEPPEDLRWDAEAFAYPYAVFSDETLFEEPAHRSWKGDGLGEKPPERPV